MSVNRANDSITNDSLAKQVADLRREVIATKSTQIVGADTIFTEEAGPTSVIWTGVAPGSVRNWQSDWYTTSKRRFLSEVKMTVFIDHDMDPDWAWPFGRNVNVADLEVAGPYVEWYLSDEEGAGIHSHGIPGEFGNKTYMVSLKNTGTGTRDYYVYGSLIYPGQTVAG